MAFIILKGVSKVRAIVNTKYIVRADHVTDNCCRVFVLEADKLIDYQIPEMGLDEMREFLSEAEGV